jgi:hypothetical protein
VKTLSDLQVRFAGSFHLTFHTVKLLGKLETDKASETEKGALRLLIPLAKLFTAKEGVAITSEILESFGGAGYIEDTGLPALLRNVQVLAIWEGTTNVLSLDVLRAIRKENAAVDFLADLKSRLESINKKELEEPKRKVDTAFTKITGYFQKFSQEKDVTINRKARALSLSLSRLYIASLLLEQDQWELENSQSRQLLAKHWMKHELIDGNLFEDEIEEELRMLITE